MFRWLKRRVQLTSLKSAREDMERCVMFLQGLSGEEAASILVGASAARLWLENRADSGSEIEAVITKAIQDGYLADETEMAPLYLNRLIKAMQSEDALQMAGGLMPWIHVLRCYSMPELRVIGQELWAEMTRGYPYLAEGASSIGYSLPPELEEACLWVPHGMKIEK